MNYNHEKYDDQIERQRPSEASVFFIKHHEQVCLADLKEREDSRKLSAFDSCPKIHDGSAQ